jgi:hypothetical protein
MARNRCTIEEIFNLTKFGRWFLVQIKEIVDFEDEFTSPENPHAPKPAQPLRVTGPRAVS